MLLEQVSTYKRNKAACSVITITSVFLINSHILYLMTGLYSHVCHLQDKLESKGFPGGESQTQTCFEVQQGGLLSRAVLLLDLMSCEKNCIKISVMCCIKIVCFAINKQKKMDGWILTTQTFLVVLSDQKIWTVQPLP